MLIFWSLVRNSVVLAVYLLFSVACFLTVHEHHYKDYIDKFDEIFHLVSKNSVYSGEFDKFFNDTFKGEGSQKQQVDNLFLNQINDWRVKLSNELYSKGNQYTSLEKLNDVVQEFINQIVFL
ncbi:hypothetical protein [Ruminococcus sp.]|uniref:hypothetical protein n=1 Tax=Ruminococcus sp. TaxID=41978 RepID=UPI0035204BE0